jgi:hypothetical protein
MCDVYARSDEIMRVIGYRHLHCVAGIYFLERTAWHWRYEPLARIELSYESTDFDQQAEEETLHIFTSKTLTSRPRSSAATPTSRLIASTEQPKTTYGHISISSPGDSRISLPQVIFDPLTT